MKVPMVCILLLASERVSFLIQDGFWCNWLPVSKSALDTVNISPASTPIVYGPISFGGGVTDPLLPSVVLHHLHLTLTFLKLFVGIIWVSLFHYYTLSSILFAISGWSVSMSSISGWSVSVFAISGWSVSMFAISGWSVPMFAANYSF